MKTIAVLCCVVLVAGVCPAQGGGTGQNDDDLVTLNVTIKNSAAADWTDRDATARDNLSVTFTATVVYRITSRDGQAMRLELDSYRNRVSVDGEGTTFVAGLGGRMSSEIPNPCNWKYVAVQPTRAWVGLDISTKGEGSVNPATLSLGEEFVKIAECTGGLALAHAHMLHDHVTAAMVQGLAPPPAESCPLEKELNFTFPAKAKSWQATGQASEEWPIWVDEYKKRVGTGSLTVQYTVTAGLLPDETEVSVEPETGYAKWIPEGNISEPDKPGNQLEMTLRVHAKGDPAKPREATIDVSLPNVSEQKGVCINWPKKAGAAKGLRFRKEDYEGGPLQWVDETHLKTREAVAEVTVVVSAHDFGAWGFLRVTALDDEGRNVTVKVRGREGADLRIPLDDDGNKIADGWEKEKGTEGYDSTWDEATAPGQRSRGDGLTLYEKYRGVVVLDLIRGRVHTRLDPHEKSHFVIDPANIFDFERWRRSTGIRAFRLDSSLVPGGTSWEPAASRRVDVNSEGKGEGTKFAVRIEAIKGLIEPDPPPKDDGTPSSGDAPTQYAYTAGSSPGDAERVRLFPDRIRAMIDRVIELIRAGLDPSAPDHEKQWGFLSDLGFSKDEMATRLANLDTLAREQLTDRMVALTAIHEMAHACGVKGHTNAKGEEDDQVQRDPSCPMQYLNTRARRLFVLHGELGGDGKLCSAPPDDCMGSVHVKN